MKGKNKRAPSRITLHSSLIKGINITIPRVGAQGSSWQNINKYNMYPPMLQHEYDRTFMSFLDMEDKNNLVIFRHKLGRKTPNCFIDDRRR